MNKSSHQYKLTIDTLCLSAKLTDEEIQFLHDHIKFPSTKYPSWYYYTLNRPDEGICIQFLPKDRCCRKIFNIRIQIQNKFLTAPIDEAYLKIFHQFEWSITRMDAAFDFPTAFTNSILFNHDKRLAESGTYYWNESYYVNFDPSDNKQKKKRNKDSLIHYDRNAKERAMSLPLTDIYTNRMEARMVFRMKDMKLHNMNHKLIKTKLRRYKYLSNIDAIPHTDQWMRNKIHRIRMNYQVFLKMEDKIKRKVRTVINTNREPLEDYYEAHAIELLQSIRRPCKSC